MQFLKKVSVAVAKVCSLATLLCVSIVISRAVCCATFSFSSRDGLSSFTEDFAACVVGTGETPFLVWSAQRSDMGNGRPALLDKTTVVDL